jgi:hypothetical protein
MPTNKPKTLERKLTTPFEFKFSKPEMVEKNGLKWQEFSVAMTARGAAHINHWAWGKVSHDLAGMSVPTAGRIPIDHVHSDDALGYIDEFDVTPDGLTLKGKFISTKEGDLAWDIATKIAAGVPYQSSIFFDDLEDSTEMDVQEVKKGKTETVNGQVFEGPGLIVRKWLLRGVAACLYGADPNTKTQALKHQPQEKTPMDPKEQLKQFTEKFGAELANKYFTEGLTFEEAVAKFCDVLQERLKASEKFAADKDEKIAKLESEITAFKAADDAKSKKNKEDDDDDDDEDGGDDDEKDDDEDKKDSKGKKASASKDQKIAELKAKLEVWEKQYGGVPYSTLGDGTQSGGTSGKDPNKEYAAELKKAIPVEDE